MQRRDPRAGLLVGRGLPALQGGTNDQEKLSQVALPTNTEKIQNHAALKSTQIVKRELTMYKIFV